ncbi:MAG TPA: permease-like cell division protein FtsX [Steroidobacteraceae bacterium]|jgi:cell division transport system permease protein|nr:permease-like cell division protein FtsX [Steroidobacteraceae bacterium]
MSLGSYGVRHLQAFFGALGRLARSPLASFLTLLVVAVALALPMGLKLFVSNARIATGDFKDAVDLSVYLKTDVALAKAQQLAANAKARHGVADVTLIPADQALAEFRTYSGFGAALEVLEKNPLPHVLHVHPSPDASSTADIETLRQYFKAWPEVELVQIDSEWVMRFNAILDVMRKVLTIAATLLGLGVVAVIGNTIRLEILNRRAEIEVTKLVGGSDGFVRRPFLYTGLFYGLGGALLAWAIIMVTVLVLEQPVATLAQLYGSQYSLSGPAPDDVGLLLGSGAFLGLVGAWISATRHLSRIEPRA